VTGTSLYPTARRATAFFALTPVVFAAARGHSLDHSYPLKLVVSATFGRCTEGGSAVQ
jgi:hypothetical protein